MIEYHYTNDIKRGGVVLKRLLLIDDSVVIHRVVEIAFSSLNVEIHTRAEGKKALDIALEINPSIILIDISLPDIPGYTLCKQFREHKSFQKVPVILLAESYEEFNPELAKNSGTSHYLKKPFEVNELIEKVGQLLKEPSYTESIPAPRAKTQKSDKKFQIPTIPIKETKDTSSSNSTTAKKIKPSLSNKKKTQIKLEYQTPDNKQEDQTDPGINLNKYLTDDPGTPVFADHEGSVESPSQNFPSPQQKNNQEFQLAGEFQTEDEQKNNKEPSPPHTTTSPSTIKKIQKVILSQLKTDIHTNVQQTKSQIQTEIVDKLRDELKEFVGISLIDQNEKIRESFLEENKALFKEIALSIYQEILPSQLEETLSKKLESNMDLITSKLKIDDTILKQCITETLGEKIGAICNQMVPDIAKVFINEELKRITEENISL